MNTPRQQWMRLLADADPVDLSDEYGRMGREVPCTWLIKPETGMVMVQARADGTGSPFCLGEMTVTRCMIQVMDRTRGYAMIPGGDHVHARLAALFDGLLQIPSFHEALADTLLTRLAAREQQRQQTRARDRSDTRVEFFTLKRGE